MNERKRLESQLSKLKNYDAESKRRMAELQEQELMIQRKEVPSFCYHIGTNLQNDAQIQVKG